MAARVWPINTGGTPLYSGRILRQSMMAPLLGGIRPDRPFGVRQGVRPGTPASIVSVTSTSWSVGQHSGVIDVMPAAEAGPYGYALDAPETGTLDAANGTNPRVDILSVQLSDPAEGDGTSAPGVQIVYTAGTPAASPSPPATPPRSFTLARLNVPAVGGGSPTVSWVAPYLSVGSTPFLVRSQDEANSLVSIYQPTPDTPLIVEHIGATNLSAGQVMRHDGTRWRYATGMYRLRRANLSANSGQISTTEQAWLTSGSTPLVSPSGSIRLTLRGNATSTVAGDQFLVRVRLNSDTGSELMGFYVNMVTANRTSFCHIDTAEIPAGGTGSTLRVTAQRVSGSGTTSFLQNTCLLIDEDPT